MAELLDHDLSAPSRDGLSFLFQPLCQVAQDTIERCTALRRHVCQPAAEYGLPAKLLYAFHQGDTLSRTTTRPDTKLAGAVR
jgi:hypothetical protein